MRRLFFATLFSLGMPLHAIAQTAPLPQAQQATAENIAEAKAIQPQENTKPATELKMPTGPCQNPLSATRNWLDNLQSKSLD